MMNSPKTCRTSLPPPCLTLLLVVRLLIYLAEVSIIRELIAIDSISVQLVNYGIDPFFPVDSSAPLLEALHLMVKWGVHRIPVVDSEGVLITIISQSQITAHMYHYFIIIFYYLLLLLFLFSNVVLPFI